MKLKGNTYIRQLDEKEIEDLRVACRLGREVLDEAAAAIAPGVTTDEIDRIVHEATVDRECYPSPLNYYQFPKSCCTSVNEVICHGIPDMRPLQNGDICNVDVTVYHRCETALRHFPSIEICVQGISWGPERDYICGGGVGEGQEPGGEHLGVPGEGYH